MAEKKKNSWIGAIIGLVFFASIAGFGENPLLIPIIIIFVIITVIAGAMMKPLEQFKNIPKEKVEEFFKTGDLKSLRSFAHKQYSQKQVHNKPSQMMPKPTQNPHAVGNFGDDNVGKKLAILAIVLIVLGLGVYLALSPDIFEGAFEWLEEFSQNLE